jgi:hypothetical protein
MFADRMPKDLPDRMPDRMSENMPEDMPDRVPEDMPDGMPEGLPVTKRIDVMVRITRSKVIFHIFASFSYTAFFLVILKYIL